MYAPSIIACVVFMLISTLCFEACASGPTQDVVRRHSDNVTRTESTIEQLTDRINRYNDTITRAIESLETVRNGASGIGTNIDKLAELFERYDRAVGEMVREFRELQSTVVDKQGP